MKARLFTLALLAAMVGLFLAGCPRQQTARLQGYIEGDYVYVASPLAGALQNLTTRKGAVVKPGDPLFALECTSEQADRDEADRRLKQSIAQLEDLKKGKRPSEIDSLEAQLGEARAALVMSTKERARQEHLYKTGVAAATDIDQARSTDDQNRKRVEALQADLDTGRLGAREDQITAAEADVRAREATLAKAEWNLGQKKQIAPREGLIFDTLYWEGEWVPAGRPVISLLPPANVKVRTFVPEQRLGALRMGGPLDIIVDGAAAPLRATVSFISPQAEYTPPVLYNRENRSKLVYMVEGSFAPEVAALLHPGQPVDVQIVR